MENAVVNAATKEGFNVNWKEVGITAGVVLVVGFVATLAALWTHGEIQKMIDKKGEKPEAPKKTPS